MAMERKIPRCMSTQHPDNVHAPFFVHDSILGGEDEIQEAYYVFSHLGCDEQMWDCEGKEVDNFVVKKLLSKYEDFFRDNVLGKDVFITLRVPNPTVERPEAKVLLETLEAIPRSFDAARLFYGEDIPPIFEVILPMTTSHLCLDRVYRYYCDFVVGKQHLPFREGDITIADWIGEFKPQEIQVIPLFEDVPHMLDAPRILREYLADKPISAQRVFFARSDPAMNRGMIPAVLANKVALARLSRLEEELGVRFFPIIGVGSAPFRGNLKPTTVDRVCREYPSAYTFTIQSAFKYDYPPEQVRKGVEQLIGRTPGRPPSIDEERAVELAERLSCAYQEQMVRLAPLINKAARHVPPRRKRKLHVGLFGYARSVEGITLPRAISFTAALYSLGLPPEILGLHGLTPDDLRFLDEAYPGWREDLRDAATFLDPSALELLLPEERKALYRLDPVADSPRDPEHLEISRGIRKRLDAGQEEGLGELVVRAAHLRRFLG